MLCVLTETDRGVFLAEDFIVPLELPELESPSVASTLAAEGAPSQEHLSRADQKRLDAVGWRMLNLPLIVCQSANGMPFFFPLQKVTGTTLMSYIMFTTKQQYASTHLMAI